MCRGLYTIRRGVHGSKQEAAAWALQQFPEWACVIERALNASNAAPAGDDDHRETQRFIEFALHSIDRVRSPR